MCQVVKYIFVGFFVALCSAAWCAAEMSNSLDTSSNPSDLSNSENDSDNYQMTKRQLVPLPRAGRSAWTNDGLVPVIRAGRSSVVPFPRAGRSSSSIPLPRAGRAGAQGLLPIARAGRAGVQGMLPIVRAGRSGAQGMLPIARAGRAMHNGMLPIARTGRSDTLLPLPRAGRSDGIVPMLRTGRSEGLVPFPRSGRSEGLVPFPRTGRSSTQGLVPIPRAGRSLSLSCNEDDETSSSNCLMHDLMMSSNNEYDENDEQQPMERKKRSLASTSPLQNLPDTSTNTTTVTNSNSSITNSSTADDAFSVNGMTIILRPRTSSYRLMDDILLRQWRTAFDRVDFSLPVPIPMSGSPSLFSNSLEDEIDSSLDPIDLQLRAVYIPRIGKRGPMAGLPAGIPSFSTSDLLKRTTGFQPRIGRGMMFQPRTGRSMSNDGDDLGIDEVIIDGRPSRSNFTPRIGRSVSGSKASDEQMQSNNQKMSRG